ncbi:MAG: hypothetical protein QOF78_682 [Phycisphaerales bacterium]|jgi:hypothetical protein|nr:hypothetical protein [Phycisphaerales bacterium]
MTVLNYAEVRYYRHTGRAPIIGTTIATIVAWVAVALVGAAYAYIQLYVKVVDILSFAFVAGFAAAMMFTVYGVLKWAKVRNMAITALVAISAAIFGWYVSWVAWEHALLRQSGVNVGIHTVAQRPDLVWNLARRINEEGTFSLRDRPIKGTELWVAWVFEGLIVLGATIALPIMWLRDMAFCESCRKWCTKREGVVRAVDGDEAALRDRMEAKDFAHLLALGLCNADTPVQFRADLYACVNCPDTHLLTVSRASVSYNDKGHRQEKATKIVDRLWIDKAQAEELRSLPQTWQEQREAEARAAGAAGAVSAVSAGDETWTLSGSKPPASSAVPAPPTGLANLGFAEPPESPQPEDGKKNA